MGTSVSQGKIGKGGPNVVEPEAAPPAAEGRGHELDHQLANGARLTTLVPGTGISATHRVAPKRRY